MSILRRRICLAISLPLVLMLVAPTSGQEQSQQTPQTRKAQNQSGENGAPHTRRAQNQTGENGAPKEAKNLKGHFSFAKRHRTPKDKTKPIQWHWLNINLDNGVPVGGNLNLVVKPNGHWRYWGHFHDSGFFPYTIESVVGLKDSKGKTFTFSQQGNMSGTISFSGSRDYNFNKQGTSDKIKDSWDALTKGHDISCTGGCNANMGSILDELLKAIEAVASVVVSIC